MLRKLVSLFILILLISIPKMLFAEEQNNDKFSFNGISFSANFDDVQDQLIFEDENQIHIKRYHKNQIINIDSIPVKSIEYNFFQNKLLSINIKIENNYNNYKNLVEYTRRKYGENFRFSKNDYSEGYHYDFGNYEVVVGFRYIDEAGGLDFRNKQTDMDLFNFCKEEDNRRRQQ